MLEICDHAEEFVEFDKDAARFRYCGIELVFLVGSEIEEVGGGRECVGDEKLLFEECRGRIFGWLGRWCILMGCHYCSRCIQMYLPNGRIYEVSRNILIRHCGAVTWEYLPGHTVSTLHSTSIVAKIAFERLRLTNFSTPTEVREASAVASS
jgi:hypothetical protein